MTRRWFSPQAGRSPTSGPHLLADIAVIRDHFGEELRPAAFWLIGEGRLVGTFVIEFALGVILAAVLMHRAEAANSLVHRLLDQLGGTSATRMGQPRGGCDPVDGLRPSGVRSGPDGGGDGRLCPRRAAALADPGAGHLHPRARPDRARPDLGAGGAVALDDGPARLRGLPRGLGHPCRRCLRQRGQGALRLAWRADTGAPCLPGSGRRAPDLGDRRDLRGTRDRRRGLPTRRAVGGDRGRSRRGVVVASCHASRIWTRRQERLDG